MNGQAAPTHNKAQQKGRGRAGSGGLHAAAAHLQNAGQQIGDFRGVRPRPYQRSGDHMLKEARQAAGVGQGEQGGEQHHEAAHVQQRAAGGVDRFHKRCRNRQTGSRPPGLHGYPIHHRMPAHPHPLPDTHQQRSGDVGGKQHRPVPHAAQHARPHGGNDEGWPGIDAEAQHPPPLPGGDVPLADQLAHCHPARWISADKAHQDPRRAAARQAEQLAGGFFQPPPQGLADTRADQKAGQHQKGEQGGDDDRGADGQPAADAGGHRPRPGQQGRPGPRDDQQQPEGLDA